MREDLYNKDYRAREYDKLSEPVPQRLPKKHSYLSVILVGLVVLLVCSLSYDNIVKPYIEKRNQQTESPISSSTNLIDESATNDEDDITSIEDDGLAIEIIEEPIQRTHPVTTEQIESETSSDLNEPEIETTTKPAESAGLVQPEESRERSTSTESIQEDERDLTTLEILERRTHDNVVKQARRAGVSTEGSTTEILERITHANVVKQARQAGVSTEGSTTEILERITHANVVKQARQAGVSTEGSTTEILERITHANVVKQAQQAGVSTEGSTTEILERITRKKMQRLGY